MATATHNLGALALVSKIDTVTVWSRELWLEAFSMARRMIVAGKGHGLATRWTWYLEHARRRFGASGWRLAQAAGRLVFDRRAGGVAPSGGVDERERPGVGRRTRGPRQGNLVGVVAYRCATVERMRGYGFTLAWTHDELAS